MPVLSSRKNFTYDDCRKVLPYIILFTCSFREPICGEHGNACYALNKIMNAQNTMKLKVVIIGKLTLRYVSMGTAKNAYTTKKLCSAHLICSI
jgi:hypothetical protein